ncbi:four-carbon acid sugar kinase family protein [Muricoccus pecuniae]|uniref:Uncharacterized protein YgbK (DUF1537 family) n=1 Tax=Muricoccus pecuniae TaxID=693023 RepID=A0A840Y658_9PROT|nr:four-carbon acid sugar kinase family protein [Roseomonas pecuniae]MBB5695320.1 uncharacterized protein YgbK (DUF1537 family) [Roseomonas pecuniae]
MSAPLYGWYGDDFTGATDTLAELARRGMRAMLFLSVPDAARLERAGPLDAVGIAGASRSMPPGRMEAELEPVGRFFAGLGVRVMHYKCCSTFDSAPEVGSIGAAVRALRPFFPNPFRPVVGGQPNIGRYLLFANLFAAAGTGGQVHRIDRHPTMRAHPVTPMGEADLRVHLAAQGLRAASLPYPALDLGEEVRGRLLDELLLDEPDAVLLDVARPTDLSAIGRVMRLRAEGGAMLAIGPSGVAQAWCAERPETASGSPLRPERGPVLVMAGSLSPITRRQIDEAGEYQQVIADPARLAGERGFAEAVAAETAALLSQGRDVLLATSPPDGAPPRPEAAAEAMALLLRRVLRECPVRRLGVAGGDTSSLAARALGFWGLSCAGILSPGVALCRGHSDDPRLDGMDVMLKGGQMGPPDLLARFRTEARMRAPATTAPV